MSQESQQLHCEMVDLGSGETKGFTDELDGVGGGGSGGRGKRSMEDDRSTLSQRSTPFLFCVFQAIGRIPKNS